MAKFIETFFAQINHSDYGQFYSIADYHRGMVRNTICWSWGAHDYKNIGGKFLNFKVQGKKFKGRVFIGVNGKDLLDIFFTNISGNIVHTINDIFIEDFIDVIDRYVETD